MATSLPVVEALLARALGLQDGQVIQATVQSRGGDQMGLLLRGKLLELPQSAQWSAGQNLNLRALMNADGSLTLIRLMTQGQGPVPTPTPTSPSRPQDRASPGNTKPSQSGTTGSSSASRSTPPTPQGLEAQASTKAISIYAQGRDPPDANAYAIQQNIRVPAALPGTAKEALPNAALPNAALPNAALPNAALPVPARAAFNVLAPVTLGAMQSLSSAPPSPAPLGPNDYFSRMGSLLYRPEGQPFLTQLFQSKTIETALTQIATVNQQELQSLWARMRPRISDLSPDLLRLALGAALGTERNLLRGRASLPNTVLDAKQFLYKMRGAISGVNDGSNPDEISVQSWEQLNELQRSIDDLESAQLKTALQTGPQNNGDQAEPQLTEPPKDWSFQMVLPFRDADPLNLHFERRNNPDSHQAHFTVNVHSRSVDFGELWLKTELLGPTKVKLTMWAERESVANMARSGIDGLQEQLQSVGLSAPALQVIHGSRPLGDLDPGNDIPSDSTKPAPIGTVLDIRA